MTNCEEIRKSLGAWLDGELGGREAEAVGEHLRGCAGCLAEKGRLERLQFVLKGGLEKEASEVAFGPFWRGVEQRIAERRPWYEGFLEGLHQLLQPQRLAWAAPLLILLALALFYLEPYLGDWRPGQNHLAAVESIDGHGYNVAVFKESKSKTTVIWLFENQEDEEEASEETKPAPPSF